MRTSRVRSSETIAACGMPTSLAGLDEATLHANELVLEKLLGSRPLLGLLAQAEQDELRRRTRARMHARSTRLGRCPAGLGLRARVGVALTSRNGCEKLSGSCGGGSLRI